MYFHELLITLIGVATSNPLMSLRAKLLMDPLFLPFPKTSCSLLFTLALSLQLLLLSQTSLSFSFNASNNSSFTKCLHHQKSALLQLKHGFSIYRGDYHASSRLDSWNPATDCCSWEGITCNEAMGSVIGLDLSSNWRIDERSSLIEGRINSNLFHLDSLQKLNLSGNFFYPNPIPSKLGQLTNLTHLDLSYSSLSGQIPLRILELNQLVSLNLSENDGLKLKNPNLTTLIGNLSNLQELLLDNVNISGEYGGKWAQALSIALPKLHRLSLRYCGLQGPIDSSLFRLPFLFELSLDENNLSVLGPNFLGDSFTLTSLSLRYCDLYGQFPDSVFLLPNLQKLDISYNLNLTIQLPEFPQNSALRYLYLGNININEKLLDSIGNLKFLKALSLRNCSLSGSLPPTLTNLTQLEYLDLSSNNLSGTIPLTYGDKLRHLTDLRLYDNSLEGSIPLSLFSHPSLQYLYLFHNQFNGWLLDFYNVSSSVLEVVYLGNNKLHRPIPRSIFQLTQLTDLSLYNNNFTGTIGLHKFLNMKNLVFLDLSNNCLSFTDSNGTSHHMSSSQIRYLELCSCNISKFPNILQNLNQLQYLDLSNNKIHDEIPSWIWKVGNQTLYYLNLSNNFLESFEHPFPKLSFTSLEIVDLHSNRLQGSLPVFPPEVYFHDYSNNNFSSVVPGTINFTFIQYFLVSSNNVSGEIPLSICNARSLEILDMSDNNFSGKIPECIGKIGSSIKILNLRRNAFQGNVLAMFEKDCNLRTLNLDSNKLEGPIPRSLAKCKALEVLDLGNNHLNDTFPFWLENFVRLRILILRSNRFHGPIAHFDDENPLFPFLQILDISFNYFMGTVPTKFFLNWKAMMGEDGCSSLSSNDQVVRYQLMRVGSYYQDSVMVTMKGLDLEMVKILTAMTSVDFSNNNFEGNIPKSIGKLNLLHVLNFSENDFTGPIPASLKNLTQLESLDLSRNNLSGEIPWQLTKLTFLEVLDLSQNLLIGSIPQSQQFLTFTNSSFLGNVGLCGPPLTKKCQDTVATPTSISRSFGLDAVGEIDWKFMWIGFGVGFGFGVGVVFWTLALWRKGSRKWMEIVDGMFMTFPRIASIGH